MPDILSLFLIGWLLRRGSRALEAETRPRLLRGLIFAQSALLLTVAASFALLENEMPFLSVELMGEDGEFDPGNVAASIVVLVWNFFPLLGRTGNAVLWGALGLWLFRSAWGDHWYRANVAMWKAKKKRAAAEKRKSDKLEARRMARRTARRARLKRAGMAVMRIVKGTGRRA